MIRTKIPRPTIAALLCVLSTGVFLVRQNAQSLRAVFFNLEVSYPKIAPVRFN